MDDDHASGMRATIYDADGRLVSAVEVSPDGTLLGLPALGPGDYTIVAEALDVPLLTVAVDL